MPNIKLESHVAVELYAATGIASGAQIQVYNNDSTTVKLSATESGLVDDYVNVGSLDSFCNDSGDAEAWAVCFSGGLINVKEL